MSYVPDQFSEILFPDREINPTEKGKEYHMAFAKAAYSHWYHDVSGTFGRGYQDRIDLLRSYGEGAQPMDIYQDMILGKKKSSHAIQNSDRDLNQEEQQNRESMIRGMVRDYSSINWINYSPAQKLKRLIIAAFAKVDFNPDCEALDERSITEKNQKKAKLYVAAKFLQHDREMQKLGFGKVNDNIYYPQTLKELEWMDRTGSFRLQFEMAIERILDKSFTLSNWNRELQDLFISDIIDLGCLVSKDCVDRKTGAVIGKYVDPKYFVAEFSRKDGFKKSRWMGEVEDISIQEISSTGEFTHDELKTIAKQYCGYGGNLSIDRFNSIDDENQNNVSKERWFYSMLVPTFNLEFKDIDLEYKTERTHESGTKKYFRSTFGKVKRGSEKENTTVCSYHTLRKVKWIIGSEFCFDFGLAGNIKRKNKKEVDFSYHPVVVQGRSLTEQCIPIYDDLQLNYLSKQNALAKAAPNGVAVNINALNNLNIGPSKIDAWDALSIYSQTGNILFAQDSFMGGSPTGMPFQQLQGGLGGQLQEFIVNNQQGIMSLMEIFGFTPVTGASPEKPQTGLGLSKIALDMTSDSMYLLQNKYAYAKEKVAQGMFLRLRSILTSEENVKAYNGKYPINTQDREIIVMPDDGVELNISMQIFDREAEKADILMAAKESLKVGKSGGNQAGAIGISQAEYNKIVELLRKDRIKEAGDFLAMMEAEKERKKAQEAAQNMQQQSNNIIQQTQAKAQAELDKIRAKGEEDRKTEQVKSAEKIKVLLAESKQATIPEMIIEGEIESNQGVSVDKTN